MEIKALSSIYGKIREILVLCPGAKCDAYFRGDGKCFDEWGDSEEVTVFKLEMPKRKKAVETEGEGEKELPPLTLNQVVLRHKGLSSRLDFSSGELGAEGVESLDAIGHFQRVAVLVQNFDSSNHAFTGGKWAQDPFVVLDVKGGGEVLLQSMFLEHLPDFYVSMVLPDLLDRDTLIRPTSLHFEGGNILVGDNYAFLGADLLAKSMAGIILEKDSEEEAVGKWNEVLDRMRRALGIERLLFVGLEGLELNSNAITLQPIFHIDCYMTLGGKVGPDRDLVFLGDPQGAWDFLNGIDGLDMEDLGLKPPEADLVAEFDAIASFLRKEGFVVERIPLLHHGKNWFSYNNCLVESYYKSDGTLVKNAWLPQYLNHPDRQKNFDACILALNMEVERILTSWDFTVRFINCRSMFRDRTEQKGSLNCLTKVLKRGAYKHSQNPPNH